MSKVFISYSHDGKASSRLAEWLRAELKQLDHEAFIYKQDVPLGVEWGRFIEEQLAKCDLLIALLSENSIRSANVIEEIQTADSRRRKHGRPVLISVRVKFDGDPEYQLRAIVNHYQWTSWNRPGDSKPLLEKILALLNNPAARVEAPETTEEAPRPTPAAKSRPARPGALARPFPMASPFPGGAIGKTDPFYVKRRIEKPLMELALKKGQTVTIEAPRQLGKSSLLRRYLAACENAKQRTMLIDLSRFDETILQQYTRLLGKLAEAIARQLDAPMDAPRGIGDSLDFGYWIEDHILKRVKEPIVIGFDEADRVFDYEYRRDLFSMLRSWHNDRAGSRKTWGRLGLVMVISTERNLLIDNATLSPFNIGLHTPLGPFDLQECLRLNARFEKLAGRSLGENDVKRLWELLRGQPYLTHEAIHAVVTRRISSVTRLIATAADDDGPFADHLRSLLKRISHRSDYNLSAAFKRIIENDAPNDQQAIGKLKAAGLVRIENGRAVPANQLYARFFGQMLGQMLDQMLERTL